MLGSFFQIGLLCQCIVYSVLWQTIYQYMAAVDSTEYCSISYMIFFVKICVCQAANSSWPCPLIFNLISYLQGQFWKLVCSFYLCLHIIRVFLFSLAFMCCNFKLISNGCCCRQVSSPVHPYLVFGEMLSWKTTI